MINEGRSRLLATPGQVFLPAAMLALTVLGFNFLGDGLRDRLDPRMRRG
jgi:ABC-type dipeptide/oligopeptide/nickel transport system permease subunit